MNKELLFEVNGFQVFKDSIYVIRDKEDLNAPSGFIKAGVTKLPSDRITENFQCAYKMKSATTGVWDTGFYKYSPCYANMKVEEIEQQVSMLKKNVVKPYEKFIGEKKALDHNNDEFWNKKMFDVYTGKVFDMTNPEDVLALYFALRTRQVTPKEKKGDSSYKLSAYIIVDINKDVKRKDEKSSLLFDAIGKFEALYASDKKRLISSLNYLNLVVADDIERDSFRGLFNEWLNQRNGENVELFLKLVDETEEESGRAKVELYLKLKEGFVRGRVIKNPNGVYYYDEHELGPDLKSAAQNIAKSKKLETVKKQLLFLNDEEDNDNED